MRAKSFDDVTILPNTPTYVNSRKDVDIRGVINGLFYDIPAVVPGMNSLYTNQLHRNVRANGGLVVTPRDAYIVVGLDNLIINSSLDTAMQIADLLSGYGGHHVLSIEIANGHMARLGDKIRQIKDKYPKLSIWAGTVTTPEGVEYLSKCGADAVILGIGVGKACTTTNVTGVGYPMFQTILDCATLDVPIISAGGLRKPADFVKAIGAGADLAMIGALVAGCSDTKDTAYYSGQASEYVKGKDSGFIEGRSVQVLNREETSADVLRQLSDALRSAMSYVGALTLSEFRAKIRFAEL